MNRLAAYSQQTPNWTRIEMLIAAFDGAMERLRTAEELIERNESIKAQTLLVRVQKIILELYTGIDLRHGDVPNNMRKLYLFVLDCIGLGESLNLPAAVNVLGIIRSGLETIRDDANALERRGVVPNAPTAARMLQSVAG